MVIIDLMTLRCKIKLLPNSNTTTQQIWFSATSKYVVTHHRDYAKDAKNLVVWDVETLKVINNFYIPKLDAKMCPLIWNCDESTALRQLLKVGKESILEFYDAKLESKIVELKEERNLMTALWHKDQPDLLAVFVSDGRNDLKRVVAPAEVRIYRYKQAAGASGKASLELVNSCKVENGEECELQWSPSGKAVMAFVETEVDETGVSYYGSTRLVLLPLNKDAESVELNSAPADKNAPASGAGTNGKKEGQTDEEKKKAYLPIQAASWSPTEDIFIMIRGYQPAQVSLWKFVEDRPVFIKVLSEKAHRNSVKWNPFGTVCLVAGFGNLAGDMDFY